MKPDVTIENAISGIKNPKAYLDGVLTHMRSCNLAYGHAFLRLGASPRGTGQYPCYRVIYQKNGVERIFGSYLDSHKPLPEPYDKVSPGAWSTSATELNKIVELATSLNGK